MRIGIFGGSFDPPHRGHLAVARAAADAYNLNQINILPVGRQPLKKSQPEVDFVGRLAMVELLCKDANDGRLIASDLDAPKPDGSPNFTIDLLTRLQSDTSELYTIVGADSFLALRSWKSPEKLLEFSHWIVVSRPGFPLDLSPLLLSNEQLSRVHLLETVHEDVSATEIRSALHHHHPTPYLTPSVATFIAKNRLYGSP